MTQFRQISGESNGMEVENFSKYSTTAVAWACLVENPGRGEYPAALIPGE